LEFLGRADRQIKLRGHRIELGEIEAALNRNDAVAESAVVCLNRSPTDQRLIAFYQPSPGLAIAADELRAALQDRLPLHMVPATLIPLAEIPHTPAGKIDYQRLPDPAEIAPVAQTGESGAAAHMEPWTETEQQIAAIWREVLSLDAIAREDNFFDLGGHSLMAAQVFSRLRTRMGVQIPLREIYSHPTVAALAKRVDDAANRAVDAAGKAAASAAERTDEQPAASNDSLAAFLADRSSGDGPVDAALLSPAEQRLWFVDQLEPEH